MNDIVAPNIPRLYTGIAEWSACLIYILKCRRRPPSGRMWCLLAGALVVQCAFLEMTGSLALRFWIPCMIVAVSLMFLLIFRCSGLPPAGAVYCTIRAFLLAEFTAALEWQLYTFFAGQVQGQSRILDFLLLILTYFAIFFLAYRLEMGSQEPYAVLVFQMKDLWPPCIICLIAFFMSNLSFVYSNTPFTSSAASEIYNIRTLVDLAGVVMLYAYHVQRRELFAQRELDAMHNVLQNQYIQYCRSRESIELIDQKHHDLKHQIAVLRAEHDPERRSSFLDEMEQDIKVYEAQNKTGNAVMDTVLTGKRLQCVKHHIELTCVADGTLLKFMDVADICAILGNILDNAIECELRIPDEDKRLIHFSVFSKNDFLMIHCENYCEEPPVFQNGIPVTTKADTAYHGYGIKSIRHTAEKYGGAMTVSFQDNWFDLNVLIPLPK